jgi:hypothetical protein
LPGNRLKSQKRETFVGPRANHHVASPPISVWDQIYTQSSDCVRPKMVWHAILWGIILIVFWLQRVDGRRRGASLCTARTRHKKLEFWGEAVNSGSRGEGLVGPTASRLFFFLHMSTPCHGKAWRRSEKVVCWSKR